MGRVEPAELAKGDSLPSFGFSGLFLKDEAAGGGKRGGRSGGAEERSGETACVRQLWAGAGCALGAGCVPPGGRSPTAASPRARRGRAPAAAARPPLLRLPAASARAAACLGQDGVALQLADRGGAAVVEGGDRLEVVQEGRGREEEVAACGAEAGREEEEVGARWDGEVSEEGLPGETRGRAAEGRRRAAGGREAHRAAPARRRASRRKPRCSARAAAPSGR